MSKAFFSFHIHTSIFDNEYLLEFESKIENRIVFGTYSEPIYIKNQKTYVILGISHNSKYIYKIITLYNIRKGLSHSVYDT
jgi:hypothetical protein